MVRPRKCRIIRFEPAVRYFKPQAVALSELEEVVLGADEVEALRLSDVEGINQVGCGRRMGFHQSTFQRTLAKAREKVADAVVNGKAIKIEGGEYVMPDKDGKGPRNAGAGRGRGFGAAPDKCKCPSCGHEMDHVRGQRCVDVKCPKCGATMARE